MPQSRFKIDPKLDLVLERVIDVPRELVWKAWTTPEHLMQWFTPAPWKTIECEIDLRPGGCFQTTMLSPDGEKFPSQGCYLEVVKNELLVFTDALSEGFRPTEASFMTAAIILEPQGKGTKYTALVMHSSEENREKHEQMGFHEGWGKALDQLVEHSKKM